MKKVSSSHWRRYMYVVRRGSLGAGIYVTEWINSERSIRKISYGKPINWLGKFKLERKKRRIPTVEWVEMVWNRIWKWASFHIEYLLWVDPSLNLYLHRNFLERKRKKPSSHIGNSEFSIWQIDRNIKTFLMYAQHISI